MQLSSVYQSIRIVDQVDQSGEIELEDGPFGQVATDLHDRTGCDGGRATIGTWRELSRLLGVDLARCAGFGDV